MTEGVGVEGTHSPSTDRDDTSRLLPLLSLSVRAGHDPGPVFGEGPIVTSTSQGQDRDGVPRTDTEVSESTVLHPFSPHSCQWAPGNLLYPFLH